MQTHWLRACADFAFDDVIESEAVFEVATGRGADDCEKDLREHLSGEFRGADAYTEASLAGPFATNQSPSVFEIQI